MKISIASKVFEYIQGMLMTNSTENISSLLRTTTPKFLDALKSIKDSGLEVECLAIIEHFNSLEAALIKSREMLSASRNSNSDIANLTETILNVSKLEYQALKEKPKADGKKGGRPLKYPKFYELVDNIIKNYKGDLELRGAKATIVRLAISKAGYEIDMPSNKRIEDVVGEKVDAFIAHKLA